MGRIEPPRALTKVEFEKKINDLKEKGVPIIFENIDNDFMKWFEKTRPINQKIKRLWKIKQK